MPASDAHYLFTPSSYNTLYAGNTSIMPEEADSGVTKARMHRAVCRSIGSDFRVTPVAYPCSNASIGRIDRTRG
jgi:hypothetical protein